MSYGPFLGGKRICLGKTFAEYFGKIIFIMMAWNYEFTFDDPRHYKVKPASNILNKPAEVKINLIKQNP